MGAFSHTHIHFTSAKFLPGKQQLDAHPIENCLEVAEPTMVASGSCSLTTSEGSLQGGHEYNANI